MRKRIALFANAWGDECLIEVGTGIFEYTNKNEMDLFAFVNYSIPSADVSQMNIENIGEFNIYTLPDLREFDGAILLTNSFNMREEVEYLTNAVREAEIPGVSILRDIEGLHCIDGDNYSGMYDLVNHLIQESGAKELLFISGSKGHTECTIRMQAFLDAAKANGIAIDDKNVRFGDWAASSAINIVEEWIESYGSLPDAVVCANDIMGMGLCEWLEENGYKVPEQVKVTGFDCLSIGQKRWPTLTTVNRNWKDMGYQAATMLFEEDRKHPVQRKLSSSLVKGGSSGSVSTNVSSEMYEKMIKESAHGGRKDSLTVDQHFRRLYMFIRKNENAEDLNRSIAAYLTKDGWMEGDYFMLCLHPDFFSSDDENNTMSEAGYPKEVSMVCCVKDGRLEPVQNISIRDAVFKASEENPEPDIYLFVPVHGGETHLGFTMMSRDFGIVEGNLLYIWTRHMNQYLEQVRSNARIAELTWKLTELSHTDILTKTHNRVGCEEIIYPLIDKCQECGGRSVLLMADVDHMKQINDRHGHAAGDLALCTVASLLRDELPKGFMVARFGGDEFLAVGEWDGAFELDAVIQSIEDKLSKVIAEKNFDFNLTVSIGGIILEAGEKFVLTEALQKADENMYREKAVHHKNALLDE